MSACPHLDVTQSYQSLEVHRTVVEWEFLRPSLQTQTVKVILEPEDVHGHTVIRNAPDFVLLSLPLLPLNKSFF